MSHIKMKPFQLWFMVLMIVAFCSGMNQGQAAGWQAGQGKAKITPPEYMPMAGYASRGPKHATGKLTDLWAKALVLQDAHGKQAVLVTLDLVGIDGGLTSEISAELKREFHWDRSQIAFCTSHTHSGPVIKRTLMPMHYIVFDEENQQLTERYEAFLKKNILQAVRDAVSRLQPATLEWNSGRTDFAVNRRENREPEVPQLRAEGKLRGPNDHDVPVLLVKYQGTLGAIVFGYACHNTVLGGMEWCGDYAGYAQIDLEKQFPGCQAMFWAGCGADQNPLPRKTVELAQEYGRRLASAVAAVVKGPLKPITPQLSTRFNTVRIPLAPAPGKEELEKTIHSGNRYEVTRAKLLLDQLAQGKELVSDYQYPIEVWKLGNDVTFVILSGEVVVDYALRLKEELSPEKDATQIWCAGYANDVMAYIPSRRVLREGGYEGGGAMVYYGLPAPWAPEIEELIVGQVKEMATAHDPAASQQ